MSERRGLLPWPSDSVYDKVSAGQHYSHYIDEQFIHLAQHNPVIARGLDQTANFFIHEFNDYCGKMHMFAGLQTHRMIHLAVQESKLILPRIQKPTAEVFEHNLDQPDDYIMQTFERLKEDNPPVYGYLHALIKSREIYRHGPGAIRGIKAGGILVYSMLELQAESDKMARDFF
jgi:hypothetical protein